MRYRAPTTALFVALGVSGCAHDLLWATGRAPWDPPRQEQLMDQIPNWDGEAMRRCGGRLPPEQRTREMSDRC